VECIDRSTKSLGLSRTRGERECAIFLHVKVAIANTGHFWQFGAALDLIPLRRHHQILVGHRLTRPTATRPAATRRSDRAPTSAFHAKAASGARSPPSVGFVLFLLDAFNGETVEAGVLVANASLERRFLIVPSLDRIYTLLRGGSDAEISSQQSAALA
jgi:hypothetical protein